MEEKIKAKIAELQKARDMYIAQVAAINGALQALTELITVKSSKEGAKDGEPRP